LDCLVEAASPLGFRYAAGIVLSLFFVSNANREQHATARQEVERGELLGGQHWISERQDVDARAELELARARGNAGQGDERIENKGGCANRRHRLIAEPD